MKPIGNQGEIRIDEWDALPKLAMKPFAEKIGAAFVISHSKQGHHHLLDGDVTVMEQTEKVPAGMRILWAIVKAPTALRQDAAVPHAPIALGSSDGEVIYRLGIKREFDPFAEQARRVAD
jgi:hypothetical protein